MPDTPSLKIKKIRYPTVVCYRVLRWCDREVAECRDVDSLLWKSNYTLSTLLLLKFTL